MDKRRIERMMEDAIMEMPIGFEVEEHHFFLYPVTLGRAYLISRMREGMAENLKEVFSSSDAKQKLDYRRAICRIVAIQTLKTKDEIADTKTLDSRTDLLCEIIDNESLFCLYDMIMDSMKDSSLFIKSSGLDIEKKKLAKIAKYKANGGNLAFGGRTPYGAIIDSACEKYGWSLEYVVWGVSLTNLEMLLADAQTSVYLSKDDMKKLRISTDREIIDANDPANVERIKAILKG